MMWGAGAGLTIGLGVAFIVDVLVFRPSLFTARVLHMLPRARGYNLVGVVMRVDTRLCGGYLKHWVQPAPQLNDGSMSLESSLLETSVSNNSSGQLVEP